MVTFIFCEDFVTGKCMDGYAVLSRNLMRFDI